MRKSFKPESIVFPEPVLVLGTYDKDNNPNAMTAAWGGIYDTNQIYICLSSNHKTSENIRERHEFSVSFATKETVVIADYFGIKSGYDENKIDKANVIVMRCENVNAPIFKEFPVSLECRTVSIKDDGTTMYVIADIVSISACEEVLDESGRIDISKVNPICYDASRHGYYVVGDMVGSAFKDGKIIK